MEEKIVKENGNNSKIIIITSIVILFIIVGGFLIKDKFINKEPSGDNPIVSPEPTATSENEYLTGNYNVDIIREFNRTEGEKNYLLSPYNIEIALNMLKEGSDGKTNEEISALIGNREISDITVKDKISVANALFIKNKYKDNVKTNYYNTLKTKYNSDVLYDEFKKPDKINDWVNEKTNGMIPKILDQMDKQFVMGLASALAIDVKWQSTFECIDTKSEEFTTINGDKINAQMMHKTYSTNAKYIKTNDAIGIVIPYKVEENSKVELEFIGILPNDGVKTYVNNLTKAKLDELYSNQKEAGSELHINLSLPRFTYDYETQNFIGMLNNLGINEAFDPNNANFKKMIEIGENVYVGEALHKTHIELSETGTKAAAVTYFGMKANGIMPQEFEMVDVKFNKPFVYMIREKNTGEILFFGTVYEPNKWEGSTCK